MAIIPRLSQRAAAWLDANFARGVGAIGFTSADFLLGSRLQNLADLGSRVVNKGASLIGVQDAGNYFTAPYNVESVLQQIGAALAGGGGGGGVTSVNGQTGAVVLTGPDIAFPRDPNMSGWTEADPADFTQLGTGTYSTTTDAGREGFNVVYTSAGALHFSSGIKPITIGADGEIIARIDIAKSNYSSSAGMGIHFYDLATGDSVVVAWRNENNNFNSLQYFTWTWDNIGTISGYTEARLNHNGPVYLHLRRNGGFAEVGWSYDGIHAEYRGFILTNTWTHWGFVIWGNIATGAEMRLLGYREDL